MGDIYIDALQNYLHGSEFRVSLKMNIYSIIHVLSYFILLVSNLLFTIEIFLSIYIYTNISISIYIYMYTYRKTWKCL